MLNEVIKKLLSDNTKLPKAYKYDLVYRDYDDMVELIGLVDDPIYDMKDFVGREMLFPRKWVTLDVLDADVKVTI